VRIVSNHIHIPGCWREMSHWTGGYSNSRPLQSLLNVRVCGTSDQSSQAIGAITAMIPPVRADLVWGSAQYGPVQPLGPTGPRPSLAVRDWIGSVWTTPHRVAISTLFLSQVPLETCLHLTLITAHLWIPTLGEIMTVLSVYFVPWRYMSPIKRPIQWKNTLTLDTLLEWSKAVQGSSVQVAKNWGLVKLRSNHFLDWAWTELDGSNLEWSIAGLV